MAKDFGFHYNLHCSNCYWSGDFVMKCTNHPKAEATKTCVGCGNFFCADCLTEINKRNYCKDCVSDLLAQKEESEREDKSKTSQPQIIIQQQQQQTTTTQTTSDKPRGSWCWFVFWLIVFFPIAIIYWFMRKWD